MDVHLGHGEEKGLLAANALLQGTGVEIDAVADLGDAQIDLTNAGGEGLRLEAVGMSEALLGSFVGLCLEDGGAFLSHGFVEQEAETFGEA